MFLSSKTYFLCGIVISNQIINTIVNKIRRINKSKAVKMIASKLSVFLIIMMLCALAVAKKAKDKPDWAKKDIRDYSEADMERLLDQWEVSAVCYCSYVALKARGFLFRCHLEPILSSKILKILSTKQASIFHTNKNAA